MRTRLAYLGCVVALLLLPACQTQPKPQVSPEPSPNLAGIPDDSPAFLCPADARLYIQVNQMARWRLGRQDDPLIEQFWKSIDAIRPPGLWPMAAGHLGISEGECIDRYFGDSFAVIGQSGVANSPFVLASRVKSADLVALPAALRLTAAPTKLSPTAATGFKVYLTENAQLYVAIHAGDAGRDGWLLLASKKNEAYFQQVLAFAASRLSGKPTPLAALAAAVTGIVADGDRPPAGRAALSDSPPSEGGAGGGSLVETPSTDDRNESQTTSQDQLSPDPSLRGRGIDAHALPHNADFQSLLVKLPAPHDVLLYTVDGKKGRHAVCLALDGRRMTAQYAGRIDKIDELYQQFDQPAATATGGVDFGLLPATAISAATVNLVKRDDKGMALLNLFIFPQTMEKDVLPKLDAPIVVFLGQVDGAKLKPDPGIRVPAVGVAIRMKDPSVAGELDRIVGGLHFFSSVGQLDILGGVLGGKTVRRGDLTYRITDFGQALVKPIKDPDTRRLFQLPDAAALTKLTTGRVGPWYLVASQEALFLECAESYAKEDKRLSQSPVYKTFPFEAKEGLMLSAMTRAPELAALTKEVSDYWAKMEAKAAGAGNAPAAAKDAKPPGAGQRFRQPMEWIGDAIKRRDSFYVQVWRDKDGDLGGKLSVVEGK